MILCARALVTRNLPVSRRSVKRPLAGSVAAADLEPGEPPGREQEPADEHDDHDKQR